MIVILIKILKNMYFLSWNFLKNCIFGFSYDTFGKNQ